VAAEKGLRSRHARDGSQTVGLAVRRALNLRGQVIAVGALGVLGSLAAIPAFGDDTPADTSTSDSSPAGPSTVEEVVVTARRAALESAIRRKEAADQIVDSVEADDAGKLPDNSITEVLQRIPGVNITHFAAINDPDHFSTEGSGPVVRGLSEINSTLNGRDSFSANGGQGLLWEDVPPELMAGVDVYKTPTADQIEGGIGGNVNLRTHMPFDYQKPQGDISAGYNYGDFVKKGHPNVSALLTDTWNTGLGRLGVLVDVAHSELEARADTLQIEPYYPQIIAGAQRYIPAGFDWRSDYFDRNRTGLYGAVQWQPVDNLTLSQTFFRSDYSSHTWGIVDINADADQFTVGANSNSVFGANGGLLSSDNLYFTGWNPLARAVAGSSFSVGDLGVARYFNRTTDYSLKADWAPTDRLKLTSALQYVEARRHTKSLDVFTENSVPPYGLNLTADPPVVTLAPGSTLANPANAIWYAIQDHFEEHKGTELAWNGDLNFTLSDEDFLRYLKVGVRIADRKEQDDISSYHWVGLSPFFDPIQNYLSDAAPGDIALQTQPDFMRGKTTLPSAVILPSLSRVSSLDVRYFQQKYGQPGNTNGPTTLTPNDLSAGHIRSQAAYLMIGFEQDHFLGVRLNGNLGARVVHYDNRATGFISPPSGTIGLCDPTGTIQGCTTPTQYTIPSNGTYFPNSGGRSYTRALPDLNVQFLLRPDLHLRLAASQSLTNPSFTQMLASGSSSFLTTNNGITGGSAFSGNPNLRPQVSNNADVSLEWYPKPNFETHADVFYKDIHDFLAYGVFNEQLPFVLPSGDTKLLTTAISNSYNQSVPALIRGAEFGFQGFADFFKPPFNGLGIQANYTYINSSAPGDKATDMLGKPIQGLPVDQLSKNSYNVILMYERNPWSVRVAYNWRSQYLLTTAGNGTNGTYTPAGGTPVVWSLPIFSRPYGQLDAGATFSVTGNFAVSVEGQNLTRTMARTVMGSGDQQYGRSWFVADRRYLATVRYSLKGK
jgi:iron complex outermembrane receptor protein